MPRFKSITVFTSDIFQAKPNRRGYLFYDPLSFKAYPAKLSNNGYIFSRDSVYPAGSLRSSFSDEIRDPKQYDAKKYAFTEDSTVVCLSLSLSLSLFLSFSLSSVPRSMFHKRDARKAAVPPQRSR